MQLDNPLDNYAKVAQIQGAQQNNMLNNMKMDEYSRSRDRQNKLLSVMGGLPAGATDNQRLETLQNNGFLDEADKLRLGIDNRRKIESEASSKEWDVKAKKVSLVGQTFGFVKDNPTFEAAISANKYLMQQGK